MASETAQLNSLSSASAFQQRSQGGHHWSSIAGHAEIGPVEVIVGPRRIPLRVQIQTEIGSMVAGVGIPGVKRNGGDLGPVRQHDDGSMQVQVKPLMIVVRDSALCRFIVHVPVDLALRAHHDGSDVSHAFIVVAKCRAPRPRQGPRGVPMRRDGGILRRNSDSPGLVPSSQTLGSSQECSLPSPGVIHSIVTPPGALLECQ